MLSRCCFIYFSFCLLWYFKLQPSWNQKNSHLSCITGSVLFRQLNISPRLEFSSGVCELNRYGSPFPLDWCTIEKAWPLPAEYPFHPSLTIIQSQNCNEISQTCLFANYIVLFYAGSLRGNWSPINHDISAVFLSQSDLICPTNLLLGSLGSLHHIILYFSNNICCRREM